LLAFIFYTMTHALDKIKALSFVEQVLHFEELGSTNTYAKQRAELPASGLTVICADVQHAGRGRGDNSFFSEINGGLYASLVCYVPDMAGHFMYNRAISCAICDAIQNRFDSSPLFIKWPNDIYWQDGKLCGILLETVPGRKNHLIIGVGVNVNLRDTDFPRDLRSIATSVMAETGVKIDIHELLYDILALFWNFLALPKADAHAMYSGRLYRVGANVEINGQTGLFSGVSEDGRLCLKKGDETKCFMSGTLKYL
jgi:BirA family transcriptional regulator, biotin operon repressor / biotin---[acetyl-CoA-carboxylase] ligase